MPSARRLRSITFTAVLAALVLLYVTTGPARTRESEFYTRTLALMKDRGRAAAVGQTEEPTPPSPALPEHEVDEAFKFDSALQATSKGHNKPPRAPAQAVFEADAKVKDRLRQAEQAAKHSADEKYKALQDVERAIEEAKEARAAAYGAGDAGEAQGEGREGHAGSRHGHEEGEGTGDARLEMLGILDKSPVVIFSKTYCPYSKKAKQILLDDFTITPTPYVVELDEHPLGGELQKLLGETTGRRTVPNILINGKSQGGGDDMAELEVSGKLKEHFLKASEGKVDSIEEKPRDHQGLV